MSSEERKDGILEVPIRASLWKNMLLACADRRVTIIIIGSCMVLVLLSRFALWPCLTALALAVVGQMIGIRMATIDPDLIDVYLRHISHSKIYLARPDVISPCRSLLPSIPKV